MNTYFERYAYPVRLFSQPPDHGLKIIVVIPCYDEPDILTTLTSLNEAEKVDEVEVILIVNEAENAATEVVDNNKKTIAAVENWQEEVNPWFQLLVYHLKMSPKDAGVGLARKAGMDEAAWRFETISEPGGVIACFDADSTCTEDYFKAIEEEYFTREKKPVGSSIYYEHPMPRDPSLRNGIIQYELHLRYYVNALRWIGYPYAYQTVGSSMVVRSDIYQKIGGMNKRKAGEDFYFLHRLIPTGYFTDITSTCIYPSPRVSQRVPFGTGKAMEKWRETKSTTYSTYNLNSFKDLRNIIEHIDDLYEIDATAYPKLFNQQITQFLEKEKFTETLRRLQKQSSNQKIFRKNFFAYLDGFKVLKYLHFSRDHFCPNRPVLGEAVTLAGFMWPDEELINTSAENMLNFYRLKDRLPQAEHI